MKEEKQRSLRQNAAIHSDGGFKAVADQLREKGLSVEHMLSLGVEFTWTEHLVKEWFKLIGEKLYGKTSTAKYTTKELQDTWEHMSRTLGKAGVFVPFPTSEPPFNPEEYGY